MTKDIYREKFFLSIYCSDNAERLPPDNILSFMLPGLAFLGYHSRFASHLYSFASYSFSCKWGVALRTEIKKNSITFLNFRSIVCGLCRIGL